MIYDPDSLYFTSDLHLGHKNIIKYSNRPFQTVEEMDTVLIANIVEKVRGDLFIIGDVSFHKDVSKTVELLQMIPAKLHLVGGNHDERMWKVSAFTDCFDTIEFSGLSSIKVKAPLDKGYRKIVLCHYAMRVWDKSHFGTWHLYGHSHGELPELEDSLSFDVGVDAHDYRPWSYAEVEEKMATKKPKLLRREDRK